MKAENVIGNVSIENKPERSYIGIRFESPFNGMFALVAKKLKILRKLVNNTEIANEGPYFLRYYYCDMKNIMDIEIGFMTQFQTNAHEVLRNGTLPAGNYATLVYRGNGLRANQAMMKWAKDNGVQFEAINPEQAESYVCRYEAYLTDYRIESRKLLWDVELSLKVAD